MFAATRSAVAACRRVALAILMNCQYPVPPWFQHQRGPRPAGSATPANPARPVAAQVRSTPGILITILSRSRGRKLVTLGNKKPSENMAVEIGSAGLNVLFLLLKETLFELSRPMKIGEGPWIRLKILRN